MPYTVEMHTPTPSAGRRPGQTNTRRTILVAAQKKFAEAGYDRTTIRSIAAGAAVDPALVIHFFKSKELLFVEAIQPVYDPFKILPAVLNGDSATVGNRLATYMVDFLEDPQQSQIAIGLVRASVNEPAQTILKDLFEEKILAILAAAAVTDRPRLRANLVCSQYIGLVMTRYVNKIEPLAGTSKEEVVSLLAPVLQQYLGGAAKSAGQINTQASSI